MAEDKAKGGLPTIVGGQPAKDEPTPEGIPVGLEQLLSMAAVEPEFSRALQDNLEQTIEASGVPLTTSERAILNSVGPDALGTMINGVRGVMPDEERREFLGRAATAMFLLASGVGASAAAGCDGWGSKVTGSRPEPIPHKYPAPTGARPDPPEPPPEPVTGSRPDLPEPPEPPPKPHGFDSPKTGSRPDEPEPPPPKPDRGIRRPSPTRGIRPDKPRPPNKPSLSRGTRPDKPRPQTKGIRPDWPDDK
jgi:hypothetical protein